MAGDWDERLSRISTVWTELRQAHDGPADAATVARRQLLERYGSAVRRYLMAAVRDPVAADDLAQEFALAVIRGEFHGADPGRGRFRDYVKTALFHLVSRWRRGQARQAKPLAQDSPEMAALAAPEGEPDRGFDEAWTAELVSRTWAALKSAQPTFHAVLHFRAKHPDLPSQQLAERLGEQLGKPLTPDN